MHFRLFLLQYNTNQSVAALVHDAFERFLPFGSARLRRMINVDSFDWDSLGSVELLAAGHQLAEPELLFEKIEDDTIQYQLDKLEATKKANAEAAYKAKEIKPVIAFDDFEKIDVRVGLIKACEKVKKADKLLKFTIDDGSGQDRTIVSGIAKYYKPEDLVGRRVCFVANLAPRKLKGIESQGMILSAEDFDGSLSVITTSADVKPGSQVC